MSSERFIVDSNGTVEDIYPEKSDFLDIDTRFLRGEGERGLKVSLDDETIHQTRNGAVHAFEDGRKFFIDSSRERLYDLQNDEWVELPAGVSPSDYLGQLKTQN